MSAINERVSDATIDEILSGVIEGVDPTTHEIAMARELQQYRAAAEKTVAWVMKDDLADTDIISTPAYLSFSDAVTKTVGKLIPLYAAPQVTSVPDESAIFDAAIDICRKSDAIDEHAWNRGVLAVMSAFRACLAATAAPAVQAEQTKRLIGWRTTDYTEETSDPEMAKNWAAVVGVLPVFEGDINTRLQAEPLSVDALVNVLRNAPDAPSDNQGKKRGNPTAIPDGWIPVSERMPELDTRVLLYFHDYGGHIEDGCIGDEGDGPYHYFFDGDSLSHEPTHWMPLPAAPNQETERQGGE